ncbi:hypothetical protein CH276_06045 [Rhodococcus sp. 06-470-2]|nr:hypothetical protein CH276_06045 [Rhodococcus sp. 06-470-2]OZE62472.1 hypothetical protein CH265_13675 [Rhodococcus sp. 05-2221-1B]OZE62739.1 hypothetical protein CH265_15280 [Rhodococcus sp. 05-2221-1B]
MWHPGPAIGTEHRDRIQVGPYRPAQIWRQPGLYGEVEHLVARGREVDLRVQSDHVVEKDPGVDERLLDVGAEPLPVALQRRGENADQRVERSRRRNGHPELAAGSQQSERGTQRRAQVGDVIHRVHEQHDVESLVDRGVAEGRDVRIDAELGGRQRGHPGGEQLHTPGPGVDADVPHRSAGYPLYQPRGEPGVQRAVTAPHRQHRDRSVPDRCQPVGEVLGDQAALVGEALEGGMLACVGLGLEAGQGRSTTPCRSHTVQKDGRDVGRKIRSYVGRHSESIMTHPPGALRSASRRSGMSSGDTAERSLEHWSEAGRTGMEAFYALATEDYHQLALAADWPALLAEHSRDGWSLLDVACGSGKFPTALRRYTDLSTVPELAYDLLDPSAFSVAEARGALGTPFVPRDDLVMTLQDLPADRTGYDIVWATHALYALPPTELDAAAERFVAALAPGGLGLVAQATASSHYLAFYDAFRAGVRDATPYTTAEQVRDALIRAGADVRDQRVTYTTGTSDRVVAEGFLQRCAFDDSVSLEEMEAAPVLGDYLASCRDESGSYTFSHEAALLWL